MARVNCCKSVAVQCSKSMLRSCKLFGAGDNLTRIAGGRGEKFNYEEWGRV